MQNTGSNEQKGFSLFKRAPKQPGFNTLEAIQAELLRLQGNPVSPGEITTLSDIKATVTRTLEEATASSLDSLSFYQPTFHSPVRDAIIGAAKSDPIANYENPIIGNAPLESGSANSRATLSPASTAVRIAITNPSALNMDRGDTDPGGAGFGTLDGKNAAENNIDIEGRKLEKQQSFRNLLLQITGDTIFEGLPLSSSLNLDYSGKGLTPFVDRLGSLVGQEPGVVISGLYETFYRQLHRYGNKTQTEALEMYFGKDNLQNIVELFNRSQYPETIFQRVERNRENIANSPRLLIAGGVSGGKTSLIKHLLKIQEVASSGIALDINDSHFENLRIRALPTQGIGMNTSLNFLKACLTNNAEYSYKLIELPAILTRQNIPQGLMNAMLETSHNDPLGREVGVKLHQMPRDAGFQNSIYYDVIQARPDKVAGVIFPLIPSDRTVDSFINQFLLKLRFTRIPPTLNGEISTSITSTRNYITENLDMLMSNLPEEYRTALEFASLNHLRLNTLTAPKNQNIEAFPSGISTNNIDAMQKLLTLVDAGTLIVDRSDFINSFNENGHLSPKILAEFACTHLLSLDFDKELNTAYYGRLKTNLDRTKNNMLEMFEFCTKLRTVGGDGAILADSLFQLITSMCVLTESAPSAISLKYAPKSKNHGSGRQE